jgi:hypothetical protein
MKSNEAKIFVIYTIEHLVVELTIVTCVVALSRFFYFVLCQKNFNSLTVRNNLVRAISCLS